MRKLTKIFVSALLISGISFASFADDTPVGTAKPKTFEVGLYTIKQTSKVKVFVEKNKGEKLLIRLKNEQGDVLHTETIGKSQTFYKGSYDLEQLQDGKYSFEIENSAERLVKNVQISTQKPVEVEKREVVIK